MLSGSPGLGPKVAHVEAVGKRGLHVDCKCQVALTAVPRGLALAGTSGICRRHREEGTDVHAKLRPTSGAQERAEATRHPIAETTHSNSVPGTSCLQPTRRPHS